MSGKLKIAIQGIEASFHEEAAQHYFKDENFEVYPCHTFAAVATALHTEQVNYAVMAIENTLAGSILPNYALIENYGFRIIGEVYRQIHMYLMALPNVTQSDIQKVQSHPMALLQCSEYLHQNANWQLIEYFDTAGAARDIKQQQLKNTAAIAPPLAAKRWDLNILAKNIQTHKLNATRFLILAKNTQQVKDPNTASISLQLANKAGALNQVLEVLSKHGINLTKIQSIPIVGKPYTYSFHLDMEWATGVDYQAALGEAIPYVRNINVLGFYQKGNQDVVFNNY